MDEKPEFLFDKYPQKIRWLSCHEVGDEDEVLTAAPRPTQSSSAKLPIIAPPASDAPTGLQTPDQVFGRISRQITHFDRRHKVAALVSFDLDGFRSLCEEY